MHYDNKGEGNMEMTEEKLDLKRKQTKEQFFFVYMKRKAILDIRMAGG